MSRPLPTVTPISSRSPLPATASTARSAKKPIMAARLLSTSAFSTKPNLGGGWTGERGGWVTPDGGAAARTETGDGFRERRGFVVVVENVGLTARAAGVERAESDIWCELKISGWDSVPWIGASGGMRGAWVGEWNGKNEIYRNDE